ncbi:MAG: zinc-binding dehydrogenase, partial [Chloroflexi bacterium]|nr:zinc-binding dehydrogenase [Chloroflexota bacterium]
ADKTEPDEQPAGHEVAGEVVEVGEGVDRSMIGKRVAIETIGHGRACGGCYYCRIGQYKQCLDLAPVEGGGFAEFIKRKAMGCYTLADNLSWEEGALVEPFAVSIHGVRRGRLIGGETVLVLGAGNIGLTTIAAARALGAGTIFATARHEQQATMAKRFGADETFQPDDPALSEALMDATNGLGADLTIETVGGTRVDPIEQAIELTRRQGRFVVVGGYRRPLTLDWLPPMLKEQTIYFSSCYGIIDGKHDYEVAIELMSSGKSPVKEMVTHRYGLDDIQKGFETAYDKTTGSIKVQIHF